MVNQASFQRKTHVPAVDKEVLFWTQTRKHLLITRSRSDLNFCIKMVRYKIILCGRWNYCLMLRFWTPKAVGSVDRSSAALHAECCTKRIDMDQCVTTNEFNCLLILVEYMHAAYWLFQDVLCIQIPFGWKCLLDSCHTKPTRCFCCTGRLLGVCLELSSFLSWAKQWLKMVKN